MNTIEFTGVLIAARHEAAMQALRLAGVPLAKAQKLILSPEWKRTQKEAASMKVKHLMKGENRNDPESNKQRPAQRNPGAD
jgi:hypothetical protein